MSCLTASGLCVTCWRRVGVKRVLRRYNLPHRATFLHHVLEMCLDDSVRLGAAGRSLLEQGEVQVEVGNHQAGPDPTCPSYQAFDAATLERGVPGIYVQVLARW